MIRVTLVTNDGNGMPQEHSVRNTTTVGDLLDLVFEGDPDDFTIQVRPAGGTSEPADLEKELCDGDRITLAPTKVEGA